MFCKVYKGNPVEPVRELTSLTLLGALCHILAAMFAMDSISKCLEWMFDLEKQLPHHNL